MDAANTSARPPDSTRTTMGRRSSVATIAASKAFAVSVSPAIRSREVPWRRPEIADSSAGWRLTDARVSETEDRIMIYYGCRVARPKHWRLHCGFVEQDWSWNIRAQGEWRPRVRRRLRLPRVQRPGPGPNPRSKRGRWEARGLSVPGVSVYRKS